MHRLLVISLVLSTCLLAACSDSDSGSSPVDAPDTPTGLAVVNTALSSLTLSWDTVDGATSYKLYRSTSATGTYTEVYSSGSTEHADEDLVYATTYYYKVSAVNSGGESAESVPVDGTTDVPMAFTVSGSPEGAVDYNFEYLDTFNSHYRYESIPAGIWIVVPPSGAHAGQWVFVEHIDVVEMYYHPTPSDYPPQTGWMAVVGDTPVSIYLEAYVP